MSADPASQTVSVVIPAYNAAGWIAEAIDSALDQTVSPCEVIVVDDGSTDETAAVAGGFSQQVRVLRIRNGGPAAARNIGIRAASGTWIGLLDADDRWAPSKLEKQLRLAGADVALIYTLLEDEAAVPREPETIGFDALWQGNRIANSSVLIRRDSVLALGGFDEDPRLKSVEDYHLWLRLAHSGGVIVACHEPLTFYRRGVGLSSRTERFLVASLYNIEKIGRQLDLPPAMVRRRQLQIMDQFGRALLHERRMQAARGTLAAAFAAAPDPRRAFTLAAACLPRWALDLRRGVLHRSGSTPPAPELAAADTEAANPIAPEEPPCLLAIIDTEEEFDWQAPPPSPPRVSNLREQARAQEILARFGVVPTYAVDYPVASRPEAYQPLIELLDDRACEIAAHLHPWVNPPVEEPLNPRNSYPGNLPRALERAKLGRLTAAIEDNFGRRPVLYRAGKYGLGPNTFAILAELGYEIDCSVLPLADLRDDGGPDFTRCSTGLSWVGPDRRLLEIPVTTGVIGAFAGGGCDLYRGAFSPASERLHVPGVLARLRLLDRIRLTPEGTTLAEAKRLVDALLRRGQRVFVLSYHSSSLKIGQTSYVRSPADLARFLGWIEGFLEYFFGMHNGRAATPSLVLERARAARNAAAPFKRPSDAAAGSADQQAGRQAGRAADAR